LWLGLVPKGPSGGGVWRRPPWRFRFQRYRSVSSYSSCVRHEPGGKRDRTHGGFFVWRWAKVMYHTKIQIGSLLISIASRWVVDNRDMEDGLSIYPMW